VTADRLAHHVATSRLTWDGDLVAALTVAFDA
jgi:hypothetical protein